MENSMPLLVRAEEAARLLGISRTRTYEMLRQGELRSVRLGRARRVRLADIEALVEKLAGDGADGR
jgi:excisionase family DNA binding protein